MLTTKYLLRLHVNVQLLILHLPVRQLRGELVLLHPSTPTHADT